MGVGAQDHLAAAGQALTGVLVDDRLVGGDVDAAVLFCGGQAEGVVILIDGAAHGAQGVVAVGHSVRNGELLQAGSLGGLNNADEGDVVGDQGIKLDLHLLGVLALVVGAQDGIRDGLFPGLVGRGDVLGLIGVNDLTVYQISALFDDFYHRGFLLLIYHCKNDWFWDFAGRERRPIFIDLLLPERKREPAGRRCRRG